MELHSNEIRDYLQRAPKRRIIVNGKLVNNTGTRLRWLEQLCRGTLDERINRRASSLSMPYPWKNPISSSIRRHNRHHKAYKI